MALKNGTFLCFPGYYNPCITGGKNPLYNPTNQGEMMVQASRTQSVFICLAMWKRSSKMSIDRDYTPRKINMEPEKDDLEDDFPFQLGDFLVPC